MARSWVAMVGTVGVTLVGKLSNEAYRPDHSGIIHVLSTDVTEMTGRGMTTATGTQVAATHHNGAMLSITTGQ